MKIVRYEHDWASHYGVVEGDTIYALDGDIFDELRPGRRVGRWGEVKLLAPCRPQTIWSNGANYPSRCYERGFPLPTHPAVLWTPGTMICGPESEIRIPEGEKRVEYGAELGVVLRRDGQGVEEAEADDYILGYTALNNIWCKDVASKGYERPIRVYDTHCPVGPVVDTDRNWRERRISLRINGKTQQDDTTSSMLFSPQLLVSWISQRVPLKRGDLIMTGTPGGVEGHVLHYGETVEVEIAGIGVLRNRVTRVDTGAVTFILSLEKWLQQQGGQAS